MHITTKSTLIPTRRWPQQRQPDRCDQLKDEFVQLSHRSERAYRGCFFGLGGMAAGAAVGTAGFFLRSASLTAFGLGVAGVGACLLPTCLLTMTAAVERAQETERMLRLVCPEERQFRLD